MKNKTTIVHIVIVACACLALILTPSSILATDKNGGHLIISRVADFGSDLTLLVSVDGSELANLRDGQSYDGYLPPGEHVISAAVSPNREATAPYRSTMEIKDGDTYSFTASWDGDDLVLVKNE